MSDIPWFLIIPAGQKSLALWIVPILYVIACLVVRARRRARQVALEQQPANDPRQVVPSVLVAALNQRERANSDTNQGVYTAACAGLIDLVLDGGVRCSGAPQPPEQPADEEQPIHEGGLVKTIRRTRAAWRDAVDAFGSGIVLERTGATVAPIDEAAFSVINPTNEPRISIAQMYHVNGIAGSAFSKNIKAFKLLLRDTLSEESLMELPSPAERLLRGPFIHVLQAWCLAMLFATGVSGIAAFFLVMFSGAFLLKRSGLLTPEGAAALERAHADVRAAQQMVQAGVLGTDVDASDAYRMLRSAVALGKLELACDLFALIGQADAARVGSPDVHDSLASLLTRYPYGEAIGEKPIAPLELVVKKIENDFYHIES